MKGHGPLSVTLATGAIFDAASTEDTWELNGGLLMVRIEGRGRAEDQQVVIKDWQSMTVGVSAITG